ncbi:MAG: SGNH/GDSL hydrolase family protein, partial [Myxococcales bacterium]|nr:SGNH/GDSL hydrolase family protein [Myxococcales bacterium]
ACMPDGAITDTAADDADSGDTEDTGSVDLDPLVGSYLPEDYAPESLARVIFVGDSITAGNGSTKNGLAFTELLADNDDDTWPDASWLDLGGIYDPPPDVVDDSRAGATTSSLVLQQLEYVTEDLGDTVAGPTAVVVTIAGNDVQGLIGNPEGTDKAVEKIVKNLGKFYDYFEDPVRFPDGAYVYLANVYEPSDNVGQADECFFGLNLETVLGSLATANAATLAQAQERGVAWIDMRGHFLGHGMNGDDPDNEFHDPEDPSVWFDEDCIHPNDRGHHEIRRLFWYALAGREFPGDGADVQ